MIIGVEVGYLTLEQKSKVQFERKNCEVQFPTISSPSSDQNVHLSAADEFSISEVFVVKPIFFIYFSHPRTILTFKYALYTYADLNYGIFFLFTIFMPVSVAVVIVVVFSHETLPATSYQTDTNKNVPPNFM